MCCDCSCLTPLRILFQKDDSIKFVHNLLSDAQKSKKFNIIVVLSDPLKIHVFTEKFTGRFAHVTIQWTEKEARSLLRAEENERLERAVRELTSVSGSVDMASSIICCNYAEGDPKNVLREHNAPAKLQKVLAATDCSESRLSFVTRRQHERVAVSEYV